MRVLHLLDSLNRGGTETLVLDLCRNARANNLELTFVATGGGELEAEFANSGVDYVRLQRGAPLDLKIVRQLREVITSREVQIVHAHQAVEGLHLYFASANLKTKRVLSHHLGSTDRKNRIALRFLVPRMDANITVTGGLLRELKAGENFNVNRNFYVVHNGVDAVRLHGERGDLRRELGLTREAMLLGMIGNFYTSARKDQMTVCEALPRLFEYAPYAQFIFVGGYAPEGQAYYEECVAYCRQRGISDRVRFLGKRADIPSVLAALDGFVFSSRQEGLPIALIEALMCGVPALVSDIPPLLEASGDGEYARVFRTGDAADLSEKLIEFVRDREARRRLAHAAQTWAHAEFSIAAHIQKLKSLYCRIINTEGKGRPRNENFDWNA